MKSRYINKILSVALLLAFTTSIGTSYPLYSGYDSYNTLEAGASTSLSSGVKLSDSNDKITLSLRDSDVRQVLRMFADKAGKNIVFHSTVSGKVTLDLVNMPLNEAFILVLQVADLNYYIQDNTLIVLSRTSKDNANFSKQEMMVFPVKYVSAASIADFLNKNVFGMKKVGISGGDVATVNAATNEIIVFGMPADATIVKKVISQLDKEPITKTFIVNHTTPAEMADMVCNFLLPAHGSGKSGGSGGSDGVKFVPPSGSSTGLAASITGAAASSNSEEVESIKLGEGVVACSISQNAKGTISTFDMQNLAIAYYPQRGTIMMVGGSEAQMNMVQDFITKNDVKQPQAYLEMSIVELSEAGSKEFQNNWSVQSPNWFVTFNDKGLSGGREGGPFDRMYSVTENIWSTSQEGKRTFEAVQGMKPYGSSYISWTMNYLIENKKARVLANPKIIITNGKESVIDLTEDYVEKVTSEFMSSAGGTGSSVGQVQKTYTIGDDKGIKVALTPFISPQGYVTMNIKPEYSTEAGREYTKGADGKEQDLAATLLNRRNLDLKNVRIKDGETLVIGGMIQEADQKTVQKIPVLGDLPLVGPAFRSSKTNKIKTELVIMITPRIINDGEDSVADRL